MAKVCFKTFEGKQTLGIFYDDPMAIKDENQMRMIIACVVKESEKDLIKPFLEKNKDFESRILPTSDSMQFDFPYRNFLSHMIGPNKVYPAFGEKLENGEMGDMKPGNFAVMEVYSKDTITYTFIYGDDIDDFLFSKYPNPVYK